MNTPSLFLTDLSSATKSCLVEALFSEGGYYTQILNALNRAQIASDYLLTRAKDIESSVEDMEENVGIAEISGMIAEEIKAAKILVSGMREDEKEGKQNER